MLVQFHVTMTLLSSIHFLRVGFFLINILSTAAGLPEEYCDRTVYGRPTYVSCIALLYGDPTHGAAGIFNIDNDEHGFLLPYFGRTGQFTIDQWRHRVTLPVVWEKGTSKRPTRLFVRRSYLADILYEDGCNIALLVKISPVGGPTTDSGSWAEIARRGKALLDYCLYTKRETKPYDWGGGVGYAGAHGMLDLVIYARGSQFDLAITSGIRLGGLVGVDRNRTIATSSARSRIGNLSDA